MQSQFKSIEQGTLLIDIATLNVISVAPGDTIGKASRIMADKRISSLVVSDEGGHPVGIVTERNILHAMQSGRPAETILFKVMSSPVVTVPRSMTCLDAYQVCLRDGIRHLVIVDENKLLLGLVSETDFRIHINLAALAGRRQISAVMSRSVFSLPPDASLRDALNLMQSHRDTCVVVVEDEQPVGIVTERDIVRLYANNPERIDIPIGDVMHSPVLTILRDDTINEAAEQMMAAKVRHLVVVDPVGRVTGLLSEHDLTHTMALGLIDNKLLADSSFLHTLVRTIPDLVWLKDLNGTYLACNPRCESFFGAKETDIVGKTDYDFMDQAQAEFFREHDRKAMENNSPSVNEEWITFAADGHRELLETTKTPMRDRQGNLIGILGIGHDITRRVVAEKTMQELNADLAATLQAIPDLLFELDQNGKYINVWAHETELLAAQKEALLGHTVNEMLPPEAADSVMSAIKEAHKSGYSEGQVIRLSLAHGECWFELSTAVKAETDTTQNHFIMLSRDITKRKIAEENLRVTASVFATSQEAILITDANNNITDVNPAFTSITGYTRAEVLGQNPKLLSSGRQDKSFYSVMWRSLEKNKAWRGEMWNRRKSGEIYAELLAISAICDEAGQVQRYVGVFSDISYLKEHEAELSHVANYDALTGMPNRRLLSDRLRQSIARAQRSASMLGICYIDLDGFKLVNDQFGHETGDQLLVSITNSLQDAVRAGDTLARLGGDEFVVLFNDIAREQECLQVLDRILNIIATPVLINRHEVLVSASIGVTFYPSDNEDGDILLRHADQAMYVAKQTGKNRYHLYDSEHDQRVRSLHESRRRILQGLENGEFELYYQPKIKLESGEVVGAEALIRWNHPDRGRLLPAEFLSFIEDSELEISLGEWVMDTAMDQLETWCKEGFGLEVSINISAHHLQSPDFVSVLAGKLALHPKLLRDKLQIEVLETAALEDIEQSSDTINECRKLGVNFALDDFGTGYSSLAYLRKLSAETLKIDQSFVRGMLKDEGDRAIVQGIIALAKTFGRKTVAEGVEATELTQVLIEIGCMFGQGYGIAHPMPVQDFLKWHKERK